VKEFLGVLLQTNTTECPDGEYVVTVIVQARTAREAKEKVWACDVILRDDKPALHYQAVSIQRLDKVERVMFGDEEWAVSRVKRPVRTGP
jgi:hypothetical protein